MMLNQNLPYALSTFGISHLAAIQNKGANNGILQEYKTGGKPYMIKRLLVKVDTSLMFGLIMFSKGFLYLHS